MIHTTGAPSAHPFTKRVPLPGVHEASKQLSGALKSIFLDVALPFSSCRASARHVSCAMAVGSPSVSSPWVVARMRHHTMV